VKPLLSGYSPCAMRCAWRPAIRVGVAVTSGTMAVSVDVNLATGSRGCMLMIVDTIAANGFEQAP